jgi:hypothetical protein
VKTTLREKTDEIAEMSDPKLWVNLDGKVVHPDAPSGGGGPGRFKSANPSGSSDHFLPGVPDPFSPDGRNAVFDSEQKQKILDAYAADAGVGAPTATGPAIIVANGWASPDGDQDRTTVGIGEMSTFTVGDPGKWKSDDRKGALLRDGLTFQWTASAAGTNTITYAAKDGTTSSVTMTVIAPDSLSAKKDSDRTFPPGQGRAGMNLTVTVLPPKPLSPGAVSFQGLEVFEGTCDASDIKDYFKTHAPPRHDKDHGAGVWGQVGPKNDASDTAESPILPAPWAEGSFTWRIPARWRKKGEGTGTPFSATSDQVVTITDPDGTTIVTKLGATVRRTP